MVLCWKVVSCVLLIFDVRFIVVGMGCKLIVLLGLCRCCSRFVSRCVFFVFSEVNRVSRIVVFCGLEISMDENCCV